MTMDWNMTINGEKFTLVAYENETTKELMEHFPLEMDFNDLFGNEKYSDIAFSLPTNDEEVFRISKGNVMLYCGETLVVFYENFETEFTYTKIGNILDLKRFGEVIRKSETIHIKIDKIKTTY